MEGDCPVRGQSSNWEGACRRLGGSSRNDVAWICKLEYHGVASFPGSSRTSLGMRLIKEVFD